MLRTCEPPPSVDGAVTAAQIACGGNSWEIFALWEQKKAFSVIPVMSGVPLALVAL